jgi:hypothetical protein
MYTTDVSKIREQLNRVLSMIEPSYIDALLMLHKKLAKEHVDWAVSGDLAEALKTVQTKPDCIEIVTSKKGATQIFLTFKDLNPKGIFFETQKLARNALVNGKEYPIYVRSHYFEFTLDGIKVKVYGDLQYRISDWEWGDTFQFTPEHVYVVGAKTAIVPLQIKYEIYQGLGWADRAEKIGQVLARRPSSNR